MKLQLYGTSACHLCDEAKTLLRAACAVAEEVDIAHDARLLDRYGMRIPVLRRQDTGAELDWPFDLAALRRFLAQGQ